MKERLVSPIRTGLEKTAGIVLTELARSIRFELDDPNGNFILAKEALENERSLLLYTNHFDQFDPVVVARFAKQYLTNLRNISGIAGLKHYDKDRTGSNEHIINATKLIQKHTGLGVILVVQEYDKENYSTPSPATNNLSVERFNSSAFIRAAKVLRTPGKILFIAPEGTRSPNAELAKAENGLDILFDLSQGTALAMSLAIIPPEGNKIRPGHKVVIKPGTPYSLEDLDQLQEQNPTLSRTDLMMRDLAANLPEQNRGKYRNL